MQAGVMQCLEWCVQNLAGKNKSIFISITIRSTGVGSGGGVAHFSGERAF